MPLPGKTECAKTKEAKNREVMNFIPYIKLGRPNEIFLRKIKKDLGHITPLIVPKIF